LAITEISKNQAVDRSSGNGVANRRRILAQVLPGMAGYWPQTR